MSKILFQFPRGQRVKHNPLTLCVICNDWIWNVSTEFLQCNDSDNYDDDDDDDDNDDDGDDDDDDDDSRWSPA